MKVFINSLVVSLFLLLPITSWSKIMYQNVDPEKYPYMSNTQIEGPLVENRMKILNSGIASLQMRIDMIRRAKKTLELEYYIVKTDSASKIIMTELIRSAKRGVKIRFLIDVTDTGRAYFHIDQHYVKGLKEILGQYSENFEIRYYNDYSKFLHPGTSYFRNHRKSLIMDNLEMITGGRNIADRYFDFHEVFNFNDRDLWVKGTIVPIIRDSFMGYWNHPITSKRAGPRKPQPPGGANYTAKRQRIIIEYQRDLNRYNKKMQKVHLFFTETQENNALKDKVQRIGNQVLQSSPIFSCSQTTFVSDRPGASYQHKIASDYTERFRYVRQAVQYRLANIKERAIISSPYFMYSKWARNLINNVLTDQTGKLKKRITIFTNSLASVDLPIVSAHFYKRAFKFIDAGAEIFVHGAKWPNLVEAITPAVETAKWGTHAKSHIYDNHSIMIGTFNFDNRSSYYNAEMAIFCDNSPQLAQELLHDMKLRFSKGVQLLSGKKARSTENDINDIYAGSSYMKVILMKFLEYSTGFLESLM